MKRCVLADAAGIMLCANAHAQVSVSKIDSTTFFPKVKGFWRREDRHGEIDVLLFSSKL